jgi:hypothetical protein
VSVSNALDSYVVLPAKGAVKVQFTYGVTWAENTGIGFHERMKQYAESQMVDNELEIHWFSVLNSVVLVLLLTGFLFIILMRVLRADYVRYASVEDQDQDGERPEPRRSPRPFH